MSIKELENIINGTKASPTIVNENSKFVVVTYWWGRGNLNVNTARPCISFFEPFFLNVIKLSINILNIIKNKVEDKAKDLEISTKYEKYINNLEIVVQHSPEYEKYINRMARSYANYIKNHFNKHFNAPNNDIAILQQIENAKNNGKTPKNYEYMELEQSKTLFKTVGLLFLIKTKDKIVRLQEIYKEVNVLKEEYINTENKIEATNKETYLAKLNQLTNEKKTLMTKIKAELNTKQVYNENEINPNISVIDNDNLQTVFNLSNRNMKLYIKDFQHKSIYDVLHENFRYETPLKFEEMISMWEKKCAESGCNYMAIEYPQFAIPGGYQMAINAKPLFIKKALELCKSRSVLYIDGDMTINKYPAIFDMEDIDFMARGWNIDPRSSCRLDESIMFDPYTFETSGGTMFFSQSPESKFLIDTWIMESHKPINAGKADDRILSMIFNSKTFLISLKYIQLPVEYLWLTMDYDERMMEHVYDYDESKMRSSIFIEHPECLTTEETASCAGASNDRQPKLYQFIESSISPVSEFFYEKIMFDTPEQTDAFRDYYNYMKDLNYINSGDKILYDKELVLVDEDGNVSSVEQPMYIIDYNHGFGKRNEIYDKNMEAMEAMRAIERPVNIQNIQNTVMVEVENDDIPQILKHLKMGRDVIYNPIHKTKYKKEYLEQIKNPIYHRHSFVFVPEITGYETNDFFKPRINLNQPILMRHGDRRLFDMLAMHMSIEELSEQMNKGMYQFLSLIRVGYVFLKKKRGETKGVLNGGKKSGTKSNRNNRSYSFLNASVKNKYSRNSKKTQEDIYMEGLWSMYNANGLPFQIRKTRSMGRYKTAKNVKPRKN